MFEKHLQTGLQIIIVAGVVWIFQEVQQLTINSATMQAELRAVISQMKTLEEQSARRTENRYTSNDALRDFSRIEREVGSVESRVRLLEADLHEMMRQKMNAAQKP